MSIFTYLKEDHREIQSLLEKIEQLGPESSAERDETFNQLKSKIILHSKAEERAFYNPLKESKRTKDEVEHGTEEHQEAETLLKELTDSSLVGSAWFQKFKTLKQALEHHIDEEETEIFSDAKKVMSDGEASQMEKDMKAAKKDEEQHRNIKDRDVA
ncbi:hemerythrin domain-containing protein [Ketobacter sp. MCCC 1A13808]|uniref:hemerythrin domain-containing protein n=1 Tax=Ketobacter sp. MCCC 1A13808 TaxID=2602738 RepID=UPI000F1CF4F5|nr:hemerythrin domain-containing protein [Ketobacter sp. MCCC 1A13808]MVF13830.1 hemerythrin domain-containing protein [Ketobacter sp. MCCC 1A13808]RLP54882.1 MAG: hemerythrin domain-containing protein [Ketobacter sp.]